MASVRVRRTSIDPRALLCVSRPPVKMSVSGMKKQLHKANQLLNEKLMGAEGTKLEEDFLKMQRSTAVIHSLLTELLPKTTEFLQPNPADRTKLNLLNTMSRIRGQGKSVGYPQTEGILGDCMLQYGQALGAASEFGGALLGMGETLHQVAQARDALGVNVKCTFIDPLQDLHDTELKEIKYQLKKVNSQRLDFDYKKRRSGKIPAGELQQAWRKFVTSKELAERSMFVLLQNDVDHLRILAALVTALLDFHCSAHHILLGLHGNMQARQVHIQGRGKTDSKLVLDQPCCRATYSFHPNQEGELDFSEGDIIVLTKQVDVNWYEGTLGSQSGLFPVCYVDVLVPLPLP
ncbi:Endophilin-A3 EEN-B2 [Takifugu flavidus]|uniref:Endophilin-A3 EEN-B2 n=1 Tax=Takifugu flavidus TaxID=433684 RepID=A0A5C6PB14_9TELE|nr:Endophilin-A3 EEN-B2 [Takifugu flavidus]